MNDLFQAAKDALECFENPSDHFPFGEWERRIEALQSAVKSHNLLLVGEVGMVQAWSMAVGEQSTVLFKTLPVGTKLYAKP